jgi:hypothetical protein
MKININIQGRTGRFDTPSFLLTANEDLTLCFNVKETRVGRYVAKFKHGENKMTAYLTKEDRSVNIPASWLNKAGAVPLEIFLELRDGTGTRVIIPSAKSETDKEGFFIEPLKIVEMEDGWSACGWLQELENAFAEINGKVDDVSERVKKFEDDGVPLTFED